MAWPLFAVASLIALVAGCGCAYLFAARRSLTRELEQAREVHADDKARLEQTVSERESAIEGYITKIDTLTQTLGERDTKLAELRTKLDGAGDQFKALAGEVLKQTNEQFLQLAKQKFAGEQKDAQAQLDQRKQAIDGMLKPITDALKRQHDAVSDLEKSRKEAYGSLRQQLESLMQDQKALRGETANLVKALRRPEVRGRWGELQLRRVVEMAGMVEHCDFLEQVTLDAGGSARLRPDVVVNMPAGRQIVVDAKTPIDAFVSAVEAETDEQRESFLEHHVQQIAGKVKELSSKAYQDHMETADFAVLFIPGESFLYAAAQRKPELIEQAMDQKVVIATPTTLIALLKVVAMGWREQQIAENARQISSLGQELHKRLGTLSQHLGNLGKAVDKTVEHYNKFVGSYDSQVMVQARRFKELGADSPKELPVEGEIKIIETQPRLPSAVD